MLSKSHSKKSLKIKPFIEALKTVTFVKPWPDFLVFVEMFYLSEVKQINENCILASFSIMF